MMESQMTKGGGGSSHMYSTLGSGLIICAHVKLHRCALFQLVSEVVHVLCVKVNLSLLYAIAFPSALKADLTNGGLLQN